MDGVNVGSTCSHCGRRIWPPMYRTDGERWEGGAHLCVTDDHRKIKNMVTPYRYLIAHGLTTR